LIKEKKINETMQEIAEEREHRVIKIKEKRKLISDRLEKVRKDLELRSLKEYLVNIKEMESRRSVSKIREQNMSRMTEL
jgi:hypothetical protein